jgi:glycosyltransferase involved in cell wall biosynthesis
MRRVADRRLTVVHVIDRLNVGGPAVHAVLTVRGLDPKRFRTVLVFGTVEPGEADMSYLAYESGIETVVIPTLGRELRPLADLRTAWELYRVLRRERADVVHTHKAKAGAIGRVVALLAGVPVRVHTFHGHVFHGYFGANKTRAFLAIERTVARISSRLIALSDGLVSEMADRYRIAPADQFTVVPLGFDLQPFASCEAHQGELRRELGVAAGVRLVGIVGRMVPVKDHATFIAAATKLAERREDVHFVFIGAGELEADVRKDLAARGLEKRAHLLGWRRNLERIYADLDVVALSSVNEGTPVALIEAMAAGIPVASTAVGGVADVLHNGDRGELCPSGDADALAAAIERALSAEARARASRIRAEVREEFDGERRCADLARLYEELLEK